ncbi:MAG: DUF4956 domain-containing protein [Kiritimatiellae bacterium]|nr:DUF4956 domain-containing protein [Kiritimatiellia bacterium]MDD5520134.1 DUF4956 domain-containing protein [Kiritimatiellia bacterium]
MDDFLTVFTTSQELSIQQILCGLVSSFVLSSVFAVVYRWSFRGLSYSRSFVHTLVLGGMITCMVIMAIGNNLARGLGILGTLAIIRFRTQIRDPRDMIFLFSCLGVGIACGAGVFGVAIVGTITLSAVMLLLHWSPFASRREYEGLLRFMLPVDAASENEVKEVLRRCCSAFQLIAMREAVQGNMIEHSYQVRLLDPSYQADLIEGLREIKAVAEPSLLMQRTTVEL